MELTRIVCPYAKRLKMAILALLLAACGGEDGNPKPAPDPDAATFSVTFQIDGEEVVLQRVEKGKTVPRPPNLTRQGYFLRGWFTDPDLKNEFDFKSPITASITLYARWEEVPDKFWIPGDNFRDTLKTLIPEAFDRFDSLVTQHADVTKLAILKIGSSSIADLTGIEYFTALTDLDCSDNRLMKLDLSQNTALSRLACSFNRLTSLDVSQNASLAVLNCSHNQLIVLDLSQNFALEHVLCQHNKLTDLNLSQNAALRILECNHNRLTSLNLLQNAFLTGLSCHSNLLTGLNVSQNAALTWLFCYHNPLTELDIRGMRSVGFVDALQIHSSSKYPPLDALKVYENLQDNAEIKEVKTARGDAVTISTYRVAEGSTDYTLVCGDYDPISENCLSMVSKLDFTVAFELNGGMGNIDTLTVVQGQTASKPNPDPTRDGYTFKGWFTDKDALKNAFDFSAVLTGDTTLYAKWEKIPKFWIPDKHFRDKLKSLIGKAFDRSDSLLIQHADVTERTSLDVGSSNIADLTGIAYFKALKSLVCDVNQLTSLDVSQNIALKKLNCRSNRLKELDVSKNTSLTELNCSSNQLTSLDMRGMRSASVLRINASATTNRLTSLKTHENAQNHKEIKEIKIRQRTALKIETYRAADGSTNYTLVCGNYDPNVGTCFFTLTFDLNEGVGNIDSLTVAQGQTASKPDPDPTREGYTFKGWFTDDHTFENEFDFTAVVTEDATLYAKWEIITYTIKFVLNGGEGSIGPLTVAHGKTASKPNPDPTRDEYNFVGWYSDEERQNKFDFNAPITSDVALYAAWGKFSISIIWTNEMLDQVVPIKTIHLQDGDDDWGPNDVPCIILGGFMLPGNVEVQPFNLCEAPLSWNYQTVSTDENGDEIRGPMIPVDFFNGGITGVDSEITNIDSDIELFVIMGFQ